MYKIKGNNFHEKVLLTGIGKPKVIDVRFDPTEITVVANNLLRELDIAQQNLNKNFTEDTLDRFKTVIDKIYTVIFGAKAYKEIVDYFEGNFFGMVQATFPFIEDVVTPRLQSGLKMRNR